ncbi:MAG: hypothetical protein KDD94_10235, partial [Calditrichaeota bacterium]|nr:hypothetical protein [Calditrichota bacterium]
TLSPKSGISFENGAQQIPYRYAGNTLTIPYQDIYIDEQTTSVATKTALGALDINGSFVGGAYTNFNDGGFTHTIAGDFGLKRDQTANLTGTFRFDGVNQNIAANVFRNVIFAGSGTKTNTTVSILAPGDGSYVTETVNNGLWKIMADLTINSGVSVDAANNAITASGNWFNTGVFSHTNTVTFNNSSLKQISGQFNNLILGPSGNSTLQLAGKLVLAGNLSLTANATMDFQNDTLEVKGNFTLTGFTLTYSNMGTLVFSGAGDQTINLDGTTERVLNNIVMKNGGTKTFSDYTSFTVNGNINIGSGTTFYAGGDVTATTWTVFGNWINNGGALIHNGTLNFNGIKKTIGPYFTSFSTLSLDGNSKTTLTSSIEVRSDLTITSSDTLDAGTGNTIEVKRHWTNSGWFETNNNNTVKFSGPSSQTLNSGGTGAGKQFYNVIVDKTVGRTATLSADMIILNDLTVLNGTFALATRKLTIGGNFSNSSTMTQSTTSTITFAAGSGTHSIAPGAFTFPGDVVFNQGATATYNMNENASFSRRVRLQSGLFSLNKQQVTFSDSLIIYNGAKALVNQSAVLKLNNSLTVENGGEIAIVGVSDTVATVTQAASTAYSFKVKSGGKIQARYYQFSFMNINGITLDLGSQVDAVNDFSDGIFSNGTSSGTYLTYLGTPGAAGVVNHIDTISNVTFNLISFGTNVSRTDASLTDTLLFYNYGGASGGENNDNDVNNLVRWATDAKIWLTSGTQDWHTDANWNPPGVPGPTENVIIPGTGNQPLISSSVAVKKLTIQAYGTVAFLANANLTINDDLLIEASGVLNATSTSDTIKIGGNMIVNGAYTSGSSSKLYFFGTGSVKIVDFNSYTPNDLIFDGVSRTWVLQQLLTVQRDFKILNGAVDVNNYQLSVVGNWQNNGQLIYRTGIVRFTGTNQSISGTNNEFYDLYLQGTGTKTLSSNLNVHRDVYFSSVTTILNAQT